MTPDALRERVADALRHVPSFWQRFNDWTSDRVPGKPFEVCRYGSEDEIVVVYACASQAEADEKQLYAILNARAQAALDATPLAEMQEEIERLREALASVRDWADAYPAERFQEPDLDAVKTLLTNAGMLEQMDRMHAAWARHLTEGFGNIARAALGDGKVVT